MLLALLETGVTTPKKLINIPFTYERLNKEHHIGTAISEIHRYTQADKKTSCYFNIRINKIKEATVLTLTVFKGQNIGMMTRSVAGNMKYFTIHIVSYPLCVILFFTPYVLVHRYITYIHTAPHG